MKELALIRHPTNAGSSKHRLPHQELHGRIAGIICGHLGLTVRLICDPARILITCSLKCRVQSLGILVGYRSGS